MQRFINYLNNTYPSIKFTYKLKKQNKKHFIDMLITRFANKLEFHMYTKPTHTNNRIPTNYFQLQEPKIHIFQQQDTQMHKCSTKQRQSEKRNQKNQDYCLKPRLHPDLYFSLGTVAQRGRFLGAVNFCKLIEKKSSSFIAK